MHIAAAAAAAATAAVPISAGYNIYHEPGLEPEPEFRDLDAERAAREALANPAVPAATSSIRRIKGRAPTTGSA